MKAHRGAEAVFRPLNERERAFSQADSCMAAARDAFSRAALSCMRGEIDAPARVREALTAVDEARAQVRELADSEVERVVNQPPARATK